MNDTTAKTMFSSDKNYWETPQTLFDELNEEFHFTLDAAASDDNHKCSKYFTAKNSGLEQDWGAISLRKSSVRQYGDWRLDS